MLNIAINLLRTRSQLKRRAHEVGLNGGKIPGAHIKLRVRGLGTNLQVGVSQGLADCVNTNVVTSLQQVDVCKLTLSRGIQLSPLTVGVFGQQIRGILHVGLGARSWDANVGGSNALDRGKNLILA